MGRVQLRNFPKLNLQSLKGFPFIQNLVTCSELKTKKYKENIKITWWQITANLWLSYGVMFARHYLFPW